jgi:hypothetical protein
MISYIKLQQINYHTFLFQLFLLKFTTLQKGFTPNKKKHEDIIKDNEWAH